jgi:hypothetical protein
MDLAFDGGAAFGDWHSLLINVASVEESDWLWIPEGGVRSIFEVVQHVGECKYAYDSHAFGDGSMNWENEGSIPSIEASTPRDEVLDWLRQGQERLRSHVAALKDDLELLTLRPDIWGTQHETRWLMNTMVQHDLYHAGELNHIRALRHLNDNWGNEP